MDDNTPDWRNDPLETTPTVRGYDKPHLRMVYPSEKIAELVAENKRLRDALGEIKHGYLVNHTSKWAKATAEAALSNDGSCP